MNKPARLFSIFAVVIGATLSGCASMSNAPVTAAVEVAKQADLATFYQLAQQAGFGETLNGKSPVTVFAPTNEAFSAATLEKLKKDPEQLKAVIGYHIVTSAVSSAEIKENTKVATLNGAKLEISKAGDIITLDDAMVTQADIKTANGVIHKIDRVLTPPAPKKG